MFIPVKLTAEKQFAATQKKEKKARIEQEEVRQEEAEHIAKLKALRLAKVATDKKDAETAAAEKVAAKNKKASRSA